MANCRICNAKIGFTGKMPLTNTTANGVVISSLDVCVDCYKDMSLLKKGDLHAYYKVHRSLDLYGDKEASKFVSIWEKVPDEVREKLAKEKKELAEKAAAEAAISAEKEKEKQLEVSKILISSGFNFDGYKIIKYSGYISGDDAIQLPRSGVFGSDNGKNLTNALVKIRTQALKELKEAAYALGCNAVIGVDFDYITLEPETANAMGGTLYEPYVICVTANGNAVIIEKE